MKNTYGLELNSPVNKNKVKEIESQLDVTFPNDYVEFISNSNGAEGSVGENYLILWAIDEIIELNEVYGVNEFAKGLVLFGSDGGDTAFAFDIRTNVAQIVSVPFIGLSIEEITLCSNTFMGFLDFLNNSK